MISDFAKFRQESSVNFDVVQIEFEFEIFDHRKKSTKDASVATAGLDVLDGEKSFTAEIGS